MVHVAIVHNVMGGVIWINSWNRLPFDITKQITGWLCLLNEALVETCTMNVTFVDGVVVCFRYCCIPNP